MVAFILEWDFVELLIYRCFDSKEEEMFKNGKIFEFCTNLEVYEFVEIVLFK